MSNGSKTLLAFLFGAASGAILGLLYAPEKGSHTRDKLSFHLDKYRKQLEDLVQELINAREMPDSEAKSEGKKVIKEAKEFIDVLLCPKKYKEMGVTRQKGMLFHGPPGTGKSHSITAIAFNSILKDQSVLVLSDKKEALDVVEDKITNVMNTVRFDKNFQNPILRLGKTGSTYSQILSKSSIDNIKTHHRAVKQNYKDIEANK